MRAALDKGRPGPLTKNSRTLRVKRWRTHSSKASSTGQDPLTVDIERSLCRTSSPCLQGADVYAMVRSYLAEGPPRRRVTASRRYEVNHDKIIERALRFETQNRFRRDVRPYENNLVTGKRWEGLTAFSRDRGVPSLPAEDSADRRLGGSRREAGKPWIDLYAYR